MKVYRDHAYIVADGADQHGMQVFDLRQLREVDRTPRTFEVTAIYDRIASAHNIVINEETGYAYSVGSSSGGETCGGGLHMIDIREPANPRFAGCFTDGSSGREGTGYSHDAQCVVYRGPDADYAGREICFGSNETALSIADVSDKDNPVRISIATYPNVAYAHQGWLTDDHRFFYMNDEGDEQGKLVEGTRTLIWDIEDLDEPELAAEYIAATSETDHNLYIRGDIMYQSNNGAGLRVLDISNRTAPVEIAYFDTSPISGGDSWSNYPYFKSGTIIVSAGSIGLFVLKMKNVDL
jgi:choice-of-anchor B domain-containing protein